MEVIDAPLVRVPFESLRRAAKERKALVDEAGEAVAQLGVLQGDPVRQLEELAQRLADIKARLAVVSRAEADEAGRLHARLAHLASLGVPGRGVSAVAWNKRRLPLLLVDHCLRSGLTRSAAALAAASGGEQLTDLHIFRGAAEVLEGLRRRDVGPAVAWCVAHRARLRKAKSSLEFKLRLQEFLELVRLERRMEAIAHARTHLSPWGSSHLGELQRALAALAFPTTTQCTPYRELFSDDSWGVLQQLYLRELYRLMGLPRESLLTVHLQSGLAALKTPASCAPGASKEDPLHLADFQTLAAGLPCAKHVHSKIICAITREVMTDANPPMVLPNGVVYSQRGIEALAAAHGGGRLVCPQTGLECTMEELRRAYIA